MEHNATGTSARAGIIARTVGAALVGPRYLTAGSAAASSGWIFLILIMVCADIAARFFANAPLAGVPEIVAFSVPACVFLAVPHAIATGRYLRADFLTAGFSRHHPRSGAWLEVVYSTLGVLVFLKILDVVTPRLIKQITDQEFFGAIGAFTAPVYPFTLAIVFGAALAALEFAAIAIASLGRAFTVSSGQTLDGIRRLLGPVTVIAFLMISVIGVLLLFQGGWSRQGVGLFAIVAMLFLVVSGLHLATALIVLSFLGLWMIRGTEAVADGVLAIAATGSINSYTFAVIPLFVLMGLFVDLADVGKDAFTVVARLMRGVRGGLGVATVFANAIFAAITGSSIASATVFTRVAVPQMIQYGYRQSFAVGTVAGSSVLGMLIPPSLLLLVYGLIAEVSIGKLFTAAIVPGILLASAFSVMVLLMARFLPGLVGKTALAHDLEVVTGADLAKKLLPVVGLVVLVLGGIYGGIFTPTESGAVGAAGALLIAVLRKSLTWARLGKILREASEISAAILFLVIAANLYSRMLTLSAIPRSISDWVTMADLGMAGFLAIYLLVVILMGMVLDSVSIMLLLLPLMLPIVQSLGGDLVWFGVVTVVAVEIGLITPPFGLAVYVVKGTLPPGSATLGEIFLGVLPFVVVMILFVIVLMAWPGLSLVLL